MISIYTLLRDEGCLYESSNCFAPHVGYKEHILSKNVVPNRETPVIIRNWLVFRPVVKGASVETSGICSHAEFTQLIQPYMKAYESVCISGFLPDLKSIETSADLVECNILTFCYTHVEDELGTTTES